MNIKNLCVSSSILLGCLVSSTQAQCTPTELDKYLAFSDENHSNGRFANSLAVSVDKAVVGAPGLNSSRGRIFFYTVDGDQMLPHSSFRALGDGSGDNVGSSVAIDGDIAVAGAPFDDDLGQQSGAAYIFRYDGANWNQEAKLLASDGAANEFFGDAVAISGNVVVIGVERESLISPAGAAYVYRYDGLSWIEEAKLLASDGEVIDRFGVSVAIEGNTIVVGADNDDAGNWPGFNRYGSAYIFQYDGVNWTQGPKMFGPDEVLGFGSNSSFGVSVAISGSRIAVGNILDPENLPFGAAFIYGTDGQLQQKIESTSITGDFGSAVALSGDTLAVGAPRDQFQGAAFLYKYDGLDWVGSPMMVSADIANNDFFGNAVAVSGNSVLIGAYSDDDQGGTSGSFYVFDQGCAASCPADLTDDGLLDFFDVSAFLAAFAIQDPVADFNNDGFFDFFDVSEFLIAFAAGCP